MNEVEQLRSELDNLTFILTDLEGKVNDLYSRPLMPHSDGASDGDLLAMGATRTLFWISP